MGVLGVFQKLRKASIIFVVSVRLSSAPTMRIFVKFKVLTFFKICRENSSLIKVRQE